MKIKRKAGKEVCMLHHEQGVSYFTFPGLTGTKAVRHLFSTREGGVSEGIFASMNFSYIRGDKKEAVDENYLRIASCMRCDVEDMVCTDQTHTDNIRLVTAQDRGKGVTRPKDYKDIDALITQEKGIVLCSFFADCVPLYFVDPMKKAIGLSHSGWKGTVQKIGKKTIEAMRQAFGTNPKDVYAAIGPSICQDCYEVSEDVIQEVQTVFPKMLWESLYYQTKPGKYQLNLWEANRQIMLEAGIPATQIEVTDICTCCNADILFSHRASCGQRGNLGAFMKLL